MVEMACLLVFLRRIQDGGADVEENGRGVFAILLSFLFFFIPDPNPYPNPNRIPHPSPGTLSGRMRASMWPPRRSTKPSNTGQWRETRSTLCSGEFNEIIQIIKIMSFTFVLEKKFIFHFKHNQAFKIKKSFFYFNSFSRYFIFKYYLFLPFN